jgi:hypothetical protein
MLAKLPCKSRVLNSAPLESMMTKTGAISPSELSGLNSGSEAEENDVVIGVNNALNSGMPTLMMLNLTFKALLLLTKNKATLKLACVARRRCSAAAASFSRLASGPNPSEISRITFGTPH